MSYNINKACSFCHSIHSVPMGKGSLIEVCEPLILNTEGIKAIPSCYEAMLRDKMNSTLNWMVRETHHTPQSTYSLMCTYKKAVLDAHRNTDGEDINEMLINCSSVADRENWISDEAKDAYLDYMDELESIADSANWSQEARAHWAKGIILQNEEKIRALQWKIFHAEKELALHDKIQDALDALPTTGKWDARIRKYASRLDALYNAGKIGFEGWYTFMNQTREKAGDYQWTWAKYEIHSLADKITYFESKIEAHRETIRYIEFLVDAAKDKQFISRAPHKLCKLASEDLEDLLAEIEAHDDNILA